jgi:hypothetical protein
MSYSKEQTQTMVLVVIIGLAVAVGSYMGMIKPNLGRASEYEASYEKYSAELSQQRRQLKANLDAVHRARAIEERMAELEGRLRHGLFGGRLTRCFEELRHDHEFDFRFTNDLERIEPINGGRYYELSNQFEILSCRFFELIRFIQVLETSHPSLRLSDIEVRCHDIAAPDGRVDARIELRVFGFKDGQDAAWESASVDTFTPESRNPFVPPGMVDADPHRGLRALLAQLQYQGTLENGALLRPAPGSAAKLVKAGQEFRLGGEAGDHVKLVRFSRSALVVYHAASSKTYRLTLYTAGDNAGRVEKIDDITPQ